MVGEIIRNICQRKLFANFALRDKTLPQTTKGNALYVMGGFATSQNYKDLYKFNLHTHTWLQLPQPPIRRRGHSSVVYKGAMYGKCFFDTFDSIRDTMVCHKQFLVVKLCMDKKMICGNMISVMPLKNKSIPIIGLRKRNSFCKLVISRFLYPHPLRKLRMVLDSHQ